MQLSGRMSNWWVTLSLSCVVAALLVSPAALGQVCRPVSERTNELGCWVTAHTVLGQLPQRPIYWHLDTFPTRAGAEAEAAKGPRGTVVQSLGKVWLFSID